jgi:hypothetical protein
MYRFVLHLLDKQREVERIGEQQDRETKKKEDKNREGKRIT